MKANDSNGFVNKLTLLMCFFNIASFSWVIFTGRYNGDYIAVASNLSLEILIVLLIVSCIPYLLVNALYRYFKYHIINTKIIRLSLHSFRLAFTLLLFWNFYITYFFGVGKLMSEVYQAPIYFTMIIVVTNRIDIVTMCLILVFYDRNFKNCIIYAISICSLGIMRNSLSACMKMGFGLFGSFYDAAMNLLKKHKLFCIILCISLFFLISFLFELRESLRNPEIVNAKMSIPEFVIGKLSGRFSSFSNLCMIIQEFDYFSNKADSMNSLVVIEQIGYGILGNHFLPTVFPEKIMVEYLGPGRSDVTFMCGVPGAIILAFSKSIFNGLTVIIFYIITCFLTFMVIRKLPVNGANEISLILVMWFAVGGSVAGMTSTFWGLLMIILYVGIVQGALNIIKKHKILN